MASYLNFMTGGLVDQMPVSVRTLGNLAEVFDTKPDPDRADEVVYRIYGDASEDQQHGQLLYATTVLEPGEVNGEFFMTRGHFHVKPERGEFMLTLSGSGLLVLMDRERSQSTEPMRAGSIHNIDGRYAHRVVNTGTEPLTFLVVWMSDCGHDYDSIRETGFAARIWATDVT